MSKYWQKEDYEPTFDDICTEWENENADYFKKWHYEVIDIIDDLRDEWDFPHNLFVKACYEGYGYNDFAAQLVDFIDESNEFYEEMMEYISGDLGAMTAVVENSRWYTCPVVRVVCEGLRSREALRQNARDVTALQKKLEKLQSDLEFYKNECSMKDEEINRLQEILDENGIGY